MSSSLCGFSVALNSRGRFKYKSPEGVVDHLVIGGGVVGLSIAQELIKRYTDKSTYVVERHERVGEEVSSRNSEVIHAGIYYPKDSLKMRMCLRGRQLLYKRCNERDIPHKRLGKLIVGRAEHKTYLENLQAHCRATKWPEARSPSAIMTPPFGSAVPTELISGEKAREMEPNISPDIAHALWCPSTGIIDSHSLITSLERDILESENGDIVYATEVVRIDPSRPDMNPSSNISSERPHEDGWVVQVSTSGAEDALLARTLINASGLSSTRVLNGLLKDPVSIYFARGSYASYRGTSLKASHLIYPVPTFSGDSHSFHSLGTHLTLDMGGNIRFGPDLEFLEPPEEETSSEEKEYTDFWQYRLQPDESRLSQMHEAVSNYLTGIELGDLSPDYVGIRPKLVGPGAGFSDFTIRTDFSRMNQLSSGSKGAPMISLLGIESPGLTSCLSLAEHVVDEVLEPLQRS